MTGVDPESRILKEEVFGPALPIVRVKNLEEAIEQANNSIFGLGSSVWTTSLVSTSPFGTSRIVVRELVELRMRRSSAWIASNVVQVPRSRLSSLMRPSSLTVIGPTVTLSVPA